VGVKVQKHLSHYKSQLVDGFDDTILVGVGVRCVGIVAYKVISLMARHVGIVVCNIRASHVVAAARRANIILNNVIPVIARRTAIPPHIRHVLVSVIHIHPQRPPLNGLSSTGYSVPRSSALQGS
jgi:hypothetical protein